MASKMLIDASHPEETRVVVMRGNRVEEFDFESANRKQLRGNIYLAKVTRVEPSLQAAFVDYGGNRHGFLAFSEIHPDYYQIPVADRQALLAAQERDERDAEAEAERRAGRRWRGRGRNARRRDERVQSDAVEGRQPTQGEQPHEFGEHPAESATDQFAQDAAAPADIQNDTHDHDAHEHHDHEHDAAAGHEASPPETHEDHEAHDVPPAELPTSEAELPAAPAEVEAVTENTDTHETAPAEGESANGNGDDHHEEESVESVGGADALEEVQERMPRVRARQYKIQEVIKRRQVMLVQVVKEERGTKGAALTTYLSLAGRYSVLMPNTSRGGGISRKITSSEDRTRLKEIAQELEVPEGMGVILRTAGASRTKTEVKRDFEYLLRIWEQVRDLTLKSTAPKLVYEEGSLVKRSIRDLYSKDIDEIVVAGEQGYTDAKEFMRMLMPSHAKNVKLYRDSQPVFTRYGIESQLDAMFTPTVQLKSGGYIVINQTEALVAIDVNSGRATREHSIEDTAVKTNSEAADEIARQLRLRDLAGLIVIDFIDMDEGRNNRIVERRVKEALKHDRARIQVGRISHFGLLEMSRQRIRTSVLESSTEKCPICGGSGHVRSVSSVTLALLRAIEETLQKGATHNLIVRTRAEVALYVLNQKRSHLRTLEERFRITITVSADPEVVGTQAFIIDRGEQVHSAEAARELAASQPVAFAAIEEDPADEAAAEADEFADAESEADAEAETEADATPAEAEHEGGQRRRRRRRGGRGRGRNGRGRDANDFPSHEAGASGEPQGDQADAAVEQAFEQPDGDTGEQADEAQGTHGAPGDNEGQDGGRRRRRRGRRGGRRHRRNDENGVHREHHGENSSYGNGNSASFDAGERPAETPAPERAPAAETAQSGSPSEPEAPRRGSTVREPASFTRPAPDAPAPTPVVSSSGSEEQAPPKRGWWGRRLLGDK
jgi:ribonuclease E